MGKVSGNRKELKPHTIIPLWNELKTKVTVQEQCKVLELPRSTFYRWLQITERPKDEVEERSVLGINYGMDIEERPPLFEKWGCVSITKSITDYEIISYTLKST